jgi:hypothetical protein
MTADAFELAATADDCLLADILGQGAAPAVEKPIGVAPRSFRRTAARRTFENLLKVKAAARSYLAPLGLGDDKTPLAELCRLAVLMVMKDGKPREPKLPPAPRADRRRPEGKGPQRPRHRSHPAD